MKHFFTSLLLLIVGGVMTAQAAGTLKILGNTVTGSGTISSSAITKGSVTYTANSVTFKNAEIDYTGSAIECTLSGTFYVNFEGNVTIKTGYNCLRFEKSDGNVWLNGDGKSNVKLQTTEEGYAPLYLGGSGAYDTYIYNTNLSLTRNESDTYGIYGTAGNRLCCHNSYVYISKGGKQTVYGLKNVWLSSSYYSSPSSITYSETNKTYMLSGSAYNGYLYIRPDLVVAGFNTTILDDTNMSNWSYNHSTKTLTLTDAKITMPSNQSAIENNAVDGLIIKVVGACDLTNGTPTSSGSIIETLKSITITGEGASLTKYLNLKGYVALYARGSGANITIDNASVLLDGKNWGLCGSGSNNKLVIKKSLVLAKGELTGAIGKITSCEMTGCDVSTAITPGVAFRSALKGFGTNTDLYKAETAMWIGPYENTYNISVLGKQVHDLNYTDVQVDGLTSGKISYDKDKNVLTLDGATLTSTADDVFGISFTKDNLTIHLKGDNTINTNNTGIYFGKDATITGDAKGHLDITSTAKHGGQTANGKSVTLNTKGRVSFFGAEYGLAVAKLIAEKQAQSEIYHYRFKSTGGNYASLFVEDLQLENVDFLSGNSKGDATDYGCYWDGTNKIRQNGGSVATGLVVLRHIEEDYGFKVGGTKVNDCNAAGIGSKYITSGGPKAAVYNNSSKTLTLNKATINTKDGDKKISAIDNAYPGMKDLTINVVGDNTLTTNTYDLYVGTDTKISGSGSLEVGSNWFFGGTMNFDNVNLKFKQGLAASTTTPATLNVNLTDSNKKIEVASYVYGWETLNALNGTQIWSKDGKKCYYNTSKKYVVYTATDSNTNGVIFTDKSTSLGINAAEIDNNAEVRDIYDANGRQMQGARKGLNIIRMNDGTVRKVMVK